MWTLRFSNLFSIVGFLIATPLYFDPGSNIFLANSALLEGGTAFPLSMLALPIIICVSFFFCHTKSIKGFKLFILISLSLIFVWFLLLSLHSTLSISANSLAYFIQWMIPIVWLVCFILIFGSFDKSIVIKFFKGYFVGASFASFYIFICGALEILFFGALQDFGRMSQNLILPGQYQLYVYTPTLLAYNSIIFNFFKKAEINKSSEIFFYAYNLITLIALLFLGSREGLLVYFFGLFLYASFKSKLFLFLIPSAVAICIVMLVFNLDYISSNESLSEIRAINKFLAMREEGAALGARDIMAMRYMEVFGANPFFGSQMIHPSYSFPELNIEVASAHNFYVDVFSWAGLSGGLLYSIFVLAIVIYSVMKMILRTFCGRAFIRSDYSELGLLTAIILFFIVSNNINVPMRQPVTGAAIGLYIAALLYHKKMLL